MRSAVMATLIAMASAQAPAQTVKTIQANGPVNNRYDIVVLGDGYRDVEESKFDRDAQRAIDEIFAQPAWGAYKTFFNVHTVFRASAESGADHPDAQPPIYVDTAYDATYNFGGTSRCLYIQNSSLALSDARLAPDVEGRVIVVVNDSRYGGCAGTFSVSYNGSSGPEVQAHEFGHSFSGLADEYDYGRSGTYSGSEPREANITAESTGSSKWPLWLGTQGVSAFQGAGYYQRGLWRPKSDCMMRNLGRPICPVCSEQIVLSAYQTVNAIENASPASAAITVQRPSTQVFSLQSLVPGASRTEWHVDGVLAASGSNSFAWSSAGLPSGRYTVTATVTDLTAFVRKDPSNLLTSTHSWTVDVVSGQPGSYTLFGAGCPGSVPPTGACLEVNASSPFAAFPAVAGTTYALETTAPRALTLVGIELHTGSIQSTTVAVPVALYTADSSGRPATQVATGTMQVGPTTQWYEANFSTPYQAQNGEVFFVVLTAPTSQIFAPFGGGTAMPFFTSINGGSSWNGPTTSLPWSYKLKCATSVGLEPTLSAQGVPEIGTSFSLALDTAPPSASAALLVGGSNTTWSGLPLPFGLGLLSAPGCSILASGEIIAPVAVGPTGDASVTIDLPNDPALVGAVFYNQFFVVDPPANGLGLAWTNGGAGTIGQ